MWMFFTFFGQARLNMNIHFYFHFLSIQTFFFHFHFLSDCRKLYGRATGHLSITICPSLCPPPISAYSLYKETNPESLFVEKVIKCAITIYLGLEKAQPTIYVKDFFHISVLLAIEQQSIECIEIFWAAGGAVAQESAPFVHPHVHHQCPPLSNHSTPVKPLIKKSGLRSSRDLKIDWRILWWLRRSYRLN